MYTACKYGTDLYFVMYTVSYTVDDYMQTVEMQSNKLSSKEVIILTKLRFYHVILFTKP